MLIYPDSSDLINLSRGWSKISIPTLSRNLTANSSLVLFSMETLIELAAPLRNGLLLEVRKHLNQLEPLPSMFLNDARIARQEYAEALSAFEGRREWNPSNITPFAKRLPDAIDIFGSPQFILLNGMRVPTDMLVNFGLADVILYLWKSDPHTFDVSRRREQEWIQIMARDRSMRPTPSLADHFVIATARNLALYGLDTPPAGIESFAHWIYESAARCPGIRLKYETQHRLRRDRGTHPRSSDLIDLARIVAVPYVDFFVADRAMMNYAAQAADEIGVKYPQLYGPLEDVLCHLNLL